MRSKNRFHEIMMGPTENEVWKTVNKLAINLQTLLLSGRRIRKEDDDNKAQD